MRCSVQPCKVAKLYQIITVFEYITGVRVMFDVTAESFTSSPHSILHGSWN